MVDSIFQITRGVGKYSKEVTDLKWIYTFLSERVASAVIFVASLIANSLSRF
jgi:hypothetical protein